MLEWASDRQHKGFRFRVLQAEETIIGGAPTGEQEQGHVNPEFLFEQGQHPCGLPESARPDRSPQALARLIGEHHKQFVQAMFLQRPLRRHTPNAPKAEIQTAHTRSEGICQLRDLNRIAEVQSEISQCLAHQLQGVATIQGVQCHGLLRPIIVCQNVCQAGLTVAPLVMELALSPASMLAGSPCADQ
jgi:hypothetical protein